LTPAPHSGMSKLAKLLTRSTSLFILACAFASQGSDSG
jgi:hypothetical protein